MARRMEALLDLRKFVAPEFVFGQGASSLAGVYAQNLAAKRVLLVSDHGVRDAGWTERVESDLRGAGMAVTPYYDISSNPTDQETMDGAELYLAERCDTIVALGGGSPMDCAKALGVAATNGCHVLDFEGVDNVPIPGPPLVCIPTTSGSGADVSQFAIITDTARKVKIAIVSKSVVPDASLVDPLLTTTMDHDLTLYTGLDALSHAVEAYVSNVNSPITDMLALEAVERIYGGLPAALDDLGDGEARSLQMLGSLYAGLAFSNAILGAVHAMAHSLGGLKDLPHGLCNAILLCAVVERNFASQPDRYTEIGRALGSPVDSAAPMDERKQATLEALRGFLRGLGMTTTLSDLGITTTDIEALAKTALQDPCMATNPAVLDEHDVKEIFEQTL